MKRRFSGSFIAIGSRGTPLGRPECSQPTWIFPAYSGVEFGGFRDLLHAFFESTLPLLGRNSENASRRHSLRVVSYAPQTFPSDSVAGCREVPRRPIVVEGKLIDLYFVNIV